MVIFVSGIDGPSVTAFYGHAKMLADHGYASILYDARAHGENEGDRIGLGYEEWQDTKAVVDYVQSVDEYVDVPIVVFGVSMGGAIAINSIGQIPEIDGLISLSAYSSWPDVFCDNMVSMGAPGVLAWAEKPFVAGYVMMRHGIGAMICGDYDDPQNDPEYAERILSFLERHFGS